MGTLLRKKLGYEVFETTNGLNAWQALDSGMAADLCILDMWMPEMGGVDLLSKLRSDPRFKRQKVILCSSEDGKEPILKAAALGVSGYLIKPFVTQHFLDQVRKVCEGGQTAPGHGALEPIKAALERLGIAREAYLELLNVFAKDVAGLIAKLQAPSANEGKREMETRISGLRGAGRCLGAEALVAVLLRLEKADPACEPSTIRSCLESLQHEYMRLIAAAELIAGSVKESKSGNKPQEKKPEPAAPAASAPAEPAEVKEPKPALA